MKPSQLLRSPFAKAAPTLILLATLTACGGGGGGGGGTVVVPPDTGTTPTTPVAQKCSANNPYRNDAIDANGNKAVITNGTLTDEKAWMLNYLQGAYLWYSEIPNVNAALADYSNEGDVYNSLRRYFNALRTPALTSSGKFKDEFSFIYPTKLWNELSQSGATFDYGAEWVVSSYDASAANPRSVRIAYVEPSGPAAAAGLKRGDKLVKIDSVSAATSARSEFLAVLYPSNTANHTLELDRNGTTVTVVIAAANVTKKPVLHAETLTVGASKVGYMVFNDHIATAEQQLIDAVNKFKTDAISDLVLDLRYNGGGYLYIASEVGYMIAGDTRTTGKTFEKLQYNDKRSSSNKTYPFFNTSCILVGNNCTSEKPLPSLNLGRVFVITSAGTCSASEAIINGLRGIDLEVVLIGGKTCGKPFGFAAKDNCGISYFPIEFQGVNHKGFGDFADGFAATCAASDDLGNAMGNPNEGMLSAALYRRANGSCKAAAAGAAKPADSVEYTLLRAPIREALIDGGRSVTR